MFNYSKLLGKIKESGYNQEKLAAELNKDVSTINAKLNNRSFFSQKEIDDVCRILNIPNDEIVDYFFAK
jgi:transcriptional regulator with XRE-family HTH domain